MYKVFINLPLGTLSMLQSVAGALGTQQVLNSYLTCKLSGLAQVPSKWKTLNKKKKINEYIWKKEILPTRILFGKDKAHNRENYKKVRSYQKKKMVRNCISFRINHILFHICKGHC